ncbi:MAG: hypothetical protein NWQ28_10060 [Nodularia sp. (in: cyanobacteria)]|nr:hypothetical protein [Nodularia sp. (in: cyanobacteria)]
MPQNNASSGFGRSSLVQSILDIYLAVEQTERWKQAVKTLNQQAKLDSNWMPVIQNVKSTGGGKYQVQFINKQNPDNSPRWIETSDGTFDNFKVFFNDQAKDLGAFFQVDSATGTVSTQIDGGTVSAGVGIGSNKADLVKAVVEWVSSGELYDKSGNPDLDTAVGVQSYLNLAQYGHGIATEAAEVISAIQPALKNGGAVAKEVSESLVSTVVKTAATEGLGIAMNIVNVVLDGIVLANTSSSVERASVTTTLVFDVVGTASSLLALGLGIAGASTAASILGVVALPIAGLAAGIPTLVALYAQRSENARKAAEPFGIIAEGYAANPDGTRGMIYQAADQYQKIPSALKPKGGAVITEIDLVNKKLKFGSQYLYQVNPDYSGGGHTKAGIRDSFFAAPDVGRASAKAKQLPRLSIRHGLGCPETMDLKYSDVEVIVLPRDIEITFDYEHGKVALGWQENESSPGINALRQIESHPDIYEKFYYDYWATEDYAISQFYPEYKTTTVTVNLDKARRSVVIPQVADIERSHLTYRLQGNGGTYIVMLTEQDIDIRIKASDNPDERWIFNIDAIGLRTYSTWLRYPDCWTVVFHDDGFTIGQTRTEDQSLQIRGAQPQRVKFEGTKPKTVTLADNIGHVFIVDLDKRNMSLMLNITKKEETDSNKISEKEETDSNKISQMDMKSDSLLYRAYVSYRYLKQAAKLGNVEHDVEPGILKSIPLTNADNIAIVFEEPDSKLHYMGTCDLNHFALVAHCKDQTKDNPPQTITQMQVDRYGELSTMRDGDKPDDELAFKGVFENVWTADNEIFFTQKIPQQDSGKNSVIQYCMYRGEGFCFIDAIDANARLMDQILAVPLAELRTSKVDRLLDQAGLILQMQPRPEINRIDYVYGKDTYTIVGQNSQGVSYQIKVHKDAEPSLSWEEGGIQYQILSGYALQLTGTSGNNTITLTPLSKYPNLKRAILFGKEGTDTYYVDQAILHYQAIFVLNYAKDTNQDVLRLRGFRTSDFSYTQQGEDIVLTHKQSGNWLNLVGVSSSNPTANGYQHLQLQFDDVTFAVTEVTSRLSAGTADVTTIFMNLEDIIFQKQGDNLVVSQNNKIDSIAYKNFYTTYTSLNGLQVKFPSTTTGNMLSLNAQQLAALGQDNKSGQTLVSNANTNQTPSQVVEQTQADKNAQIQANIANQLSQVSWSFLQRQDQDLSIESKTTSNSQTIRNTYSNFFDLPAQSRLIKIPCKLENSAFVQYMFDLDLMCGEYKESANSPGYYQFTPANPISKFGLFYDSYIKPKQNQQYTPNKVDETLALLRSDPYRAGTPQQLADLGILDRLMEQVSVQLPLQSGGYVILSYDAVNKLGRETAKFILAKNLSFNADLNLFQFITNRDGGMNNTLIRYSFDISQKQVVAQGVLRTGEPPTIYARVPAAIV